MNTESKSDFHIIAPHPISECQQRLSQLERHNFWVYPDTTVTFEHPLSDITLLHIRHKVGRNFVLNLQASLRAAGNSTEIEGTVKPGALLVILPVLVGLMMLFVAPMFICSGEPIGWFILAIIGLVISSFYFMYQRHKRRLIEMVRRTVDG